MELRCRSLLDPGQLLFSSGIAFLVVVRLVVVPLVVGFPEECRYWCLLSAAAMTSAAALAASSILCVVCTITGLHYSLG
jgi:hypothetical protein